MDTLIARCIGLVPPISASWYAIPLRLIIGSGFIHHGYAKLARGPDAFVNILSALGMFDPPLLAWATIVIELAGGLAVIAGLFIPLASVPMIVVLLVAIFTVHLPNGFSSIKTSVGYGGRRSLWTTRVRDRPSVSRRNHCLDPGWFWPPCAGSLSLRLARSSGH
jgi:uncharacterized membrane protein YphA (DoxX/SURF4 family)